jgi:polysaccharide biosynthesis protein PslH
VRLAFLTSRFPYPLLKGDKIRAYYPIKLLSARHEIDLFTFSDEAADESAVAHMRQFCRRIEIVNLSTLGTTLKMAAAIPTSLPSQVAYYHSPRMARLLRSDVRDAYDLAHVVCGRLAGFAGALGAVPKTIDWIDALSLSTHRRLNTERNPVMRQLYAREHRKMLRFELDAVRHFDYSVITSQVDRTFLDDRIDEVLANGVDLDAFAPGNAPKDIDLVFTGNMGYEANVAAVEYLCRDVLPLVLRERPGTKFFAAGATPSPRVRRLHDGSAVTVTGFVESMPEMLHRSRVFVAPLQSGAGIQNKVLEAMACGLPVVATSFGNGGIQAKAGTEMLVEDTPEGFAGAVLGLLADPARAAALGAAGRDLATRNFSWTAKVDRFEEIFRQVGNRQSPVRERYL